MDKPGTFTGEQRKAFGAALRAARDQLELSTTKLVERMDSYESAGSISHWEGGAKPPDPPVVFELEQLLNLAPGQLSQHLGYLPADADAPPCTLDAALAAEPRLTPPRRKILLELYRDFIQQWEA